MKRNNRPPPLQMNNRVQNGADNSGQFQETSFNAPNPNASVGSGNMTASGSGYGTTGGSGYATAGRSGYGAAGASRPGTAGGRGYGAAGGRGHGAAGASGYGAARGNTAGSGWGNQRVPQQSRQTQPQTLPPVEHNMVARVKAYRRTRESGIYDREGGTSPPPMIASGKGRGAASGSAVGPAGGSGRGAPKGHWFGPSGGTGYGVASGNYYSKNPPPTNATMESSAAPPPPSRSSSAQGAVGGSNTEQPRGSLRGVPGSTGGFYVMRDMDAYNENDDDIFTEEWGWRYGMKYNFYTPDWWIEPDLDLERCIEHWTTQRLPELQMQLQKLWAEYDSHVSAGAHPDSPVLKNLDYRLRRIETQIKRKGLMYTY